jgi:hypothetical protein
VGVHHQQRSLRAGTQSPADQGPVVGGIGEGHRHLALRDIFMMQLTVLYWRVASASAEDFSSADSFTISGHSHHRRDGPPMPARCPDSCCSPKMHATAGAGAGAVRDNPPPRRWSGRDGLASQNRFHGGGVRTAEHPSLTMQSLTSRTNDGLLLGRDAGYREDGSCSAVSRLNHLSSGEIEGDRVSEWVEPA